MSGMIDRNKYASLAEALADVTDIDKVVQAVVREVSIRELMAQSGESREAVTSVADAAVSMGEEAVLELMDGEPTTLGRALGRYVEGLAQLPPSYDLTRDEVVSNLDVLLKYPWPGTGPGQSLEIRQPDDDHLEVWIGGREVASANHDKHGWAGMEAVQTTAENVHRALTS